ncbi:MAG: cation transporter [Sphaerochaetaceae bacterium]|nr:cation transporter [Sphaerochaetaceae bacterium]
MFKTILKVDGMMCGMCEAHVCDVIRKEVPEAKKVSASRGKGEASFVTEEPVDTGKLKEAVSATGYTCSEVKTEAYEKKGWFR